MEKNMEKNQVHSLELEAEEMSDVHSYTNVSGIGISSIATLSCVGGSAATASTYRPV